MAKLIAPYLLEAARGGVRQRVDALRKSIARETGELEFLEEYFHADLNGLGLRRRGRAAGGLVAEKSERSIDQVVSTVKSAFRMRTGRRKATTTMQVAQALARARGPLLLREVRALVPRAGVSTALVELIEKGVLKRVPGEGKRDTRYTVA